MTTTTVYIAIPSPMGPIYVPAEQTGNNFTFHSAPEIGGAVVSTSNPMPVADGNVGTQADTAWSGSGSGSVVAVLKALWTALLNIGTVADAAWSGSGSGSNIAVLKAIATKMLNGTLATADANGAAYQGAVPIASGTPFTAGRGIGYVCTSAGTMTLTLANSSSIAVPIIASPGLQTLPFAATGLVLSGGAAGSFWNLI